MPDDISRQFFMTESSELRRTLYRRRWSLLAVTAAIAVTATAALPFLPTHYEATASVLLQPTDPQGQGTAWDQMHALDENAVQTRMDIFSSHRLQQQVIADNRLTADPYFNPTLRPSLVRRIISYLPAALAEALPMARAGMVDPGKLTEQAVLKRLSVRRERRSYLLQVSYTANDPVKAAAMTNTLVEGFVGDDRARKMQVHARRSAALQSAMHDAAARFQTAETAEHAFLLESGLIHRDAQESLRRQLEVLSAEAAQAHARSTAAESRLHTLTEMQASGSLDSAPEVLASPLIEHLRERLIGLSTGTGSANTMPMGATGAVLADLRAALVKENQHVLDTARASLTEATRDEDALRREIDRIDQLDIKIQEASRTADALHRTTAADQTVLVAATIEDATENGRGVVLQPDAVIVALATSPTQPVNILPQYVGGSLALMTLGCTLVLLPRRRITHHG
jgi:uncharacterized protein involved in exopolysaccharide biosynthesis